MSSVCVIWQAEYWPPSDVYILGTEYYVTWQRGIKVADRIKVAHQLTLKRGDYPALSRWTHYNSKSPYKWMREADERDLERWQHEKDSACCCRL